MGRLAGGRQAGDRRRHDDLLVLIQVPLATPIASIAILFRGPCVLTFRALDFVLFEDADSSQSRSIVDAVGAASAVAGVARLAFLFLPGKHDPRDADNLGFDLEAADFFFHFFGF